MNKKKIIIISIISIMLVSVSVFFIIKISKDSQYDLSGNLIENSYIRQINEAIFHGDFTKVKTLSKDRDLNAEYLHEECDDGEMPHYECLAPLEVASLTGNYQIVEFLINQNADPNYQDNYINSSPLFIAIESDNENKNKVIKLLLDNKASLNIKNHSNKTPLEMIASDYIIESKEGSVKEKNNYDTFRIVFKYNQNETVDFLQNLMTLSVDSNNLLILSFLIDNYDLDINRIYENGDTLLLQAVKNNNVRIVEYLVRKNADRTIKDQKGKTALSYAEQRLNQILIDILK